MKPLVYIILPVYNGEKYLLQQLMSIYFQDYENWYLIIINDGSTDSTQSIIEKFILDYKLKNKITIIKQSNKGLNKSIENGLIETKRIIKSSGINYAYVTYCDADDLMMTNRLSYQVDFMKNNKECDLSYHDLILIDKNNAIINTSFLGMINKKILVNVNNDSFCEFCIANHIPATTMMFEAKKIDSLLPFPKTFPFQDWRTSLIFSSNNYNIKNMRLPLGYYRRYTNQMSNVSKEKVDLVETFGNFKTSLQEIAGRIKDKKKIAETFEYINYYEDRINRIKKHNNTITQLIKIAIFHPRIIFRRIFALKNYIIKSK